MLPYLVRPAAEPAPVPRRRRARRASGRSRRRRTRPTGSPAGTTTTPTRARASSTSSPTARRHWPGWPTTARSSCTVDVADRRRAPPDVRAHRPRSRDEDDLGRPARPRPAAPHRARAPRGARLPEGHRPAGHPDLGADRGPARRSTRPAPGWSSCRGRSASTVPDLVSWTWKKRERGGLARLDYTQNAINKTLVAPVQPAARARRAGVGADHVGRARRSRPVLRPLGRWPPCSTASPSTATRWRLHSPISRCCRPSCDVRRPYRHRALEPGRVGGRH